ncbi:hypothetical protein [Oricola sp.]|uniref:hypothetical protein n=1 Tax=Oricola sp. TaxID=1979950 RepID=UPI0025FE5E9F|nr:hypothetical protein [Oricola sp.]MCI5078476.1 hypothetical protein [Oricola sp.]
MDFRSRVALWMEPAWARRAREAFAASPIDGWVAIDARAAAVFSAALAEQLPPGHHIAGTRWRAVGRVGGQDDVLFAAHDGRFAAVHLTWQKETDPRWPRAGLFASLDAARDAIAWRDEVDD